MSEVVLKIRKTSAGEVGDVLHAFSTREIHRIHIECICKTSKELWYEWEMQSCRYRHERVSKSEAVRTDMVTGEILVLGRDTKDDVDVYVKRRIKGNQRMMYGEPGKEVWFTDGRPADFNHLWNVIESKTPWRRDSEEHNLFPFGRMDLRNRLGAKTIDIDPETAMSLVEPQYAVDGHGRFQWFDAGEDGRKPEVITGTESIDHNPDPDRTPTLIKVRKRRRNIDREPLMDIMGVTEKELMDPSRLVGREINLRGNQVFVVLPASTGNPYERAIKKQPKAAKFTQGRLEFK